MERRAFYFLPDGDSAIHAPCGGCSGNNTKAQETPRHVGGWSAPDAVQGDILHVQAVPLRLPLVQVVVVPVKELSHPGAQGEIIYYGVWDNREE